MKDIVQSLAEKAKSTSDSADALRFSQAASNLAHTQAKFDKEIFALTCKEIDQLIVQLESTDDFSASEVVIALAALRESMSEGV